jgi:hypothetical protein
VQLETQIPERLAAEPAVFGSATGAEVLIDSVRRVLDPDVALDWLGGGNATVRDEPPTALLAECALSEQETAALDAARGASLGQIRERAQHHRDPGHAEIFSVLFALDALGVIQVMPPAAGTVRDEPRTSEQSLDDEARRAQILARRSLVDEGDYFAVLGVSRDATGYDIRRAYLTLRRELEPRQILSVGTADLAEDVNLIVQILAEAYDVLRDRSRRERYKRAIEAVPREDSVN